MMSDPNRRTPPRLRDAIRAAGRTGRRVARRVRGRRTRRTSSPRQGVVRIEYSPNLDGDADPGEIVWTWVPFEEDATQGKDRPVVVIGRRGDRLVGVPLTTRRDDREAQVPVGTGAWDAARRQSYARIWRMLDIDPAKMRREGAILDRDRFAAVVALVDHYYDVQLPR
jgi:hypothetical protein